MSVDNNPNFTSAPVANPTAIADLNRPKGHRGGGKRSHRSQFPTPGFYFFAFFLNLLSVLTSSLLLVGHYDNLTLLALGLTGVVGLIISIYSVGIRPRESNKKLRKVLVVSTVIFGFILLLAVGVNIVLNPGLFV